MKNLMECSDEGSRAYQQGCKLSNNPYNWKTETLPFQYWEFGFKDAAKFDQPCNKKGELC